MPASFHGWIPAVFGTNDSASIQSYMFPRPNESGRVAWIFAEKRRRGSKTSATVALTYAARLGRPYPGSGDRVLTRPRTRLAVSAVNLATNVTLRVLIGQ